MIATAFPFARTIEMERHMTNYSSKSSGSGEVYGARVLYAAMVVGAALLLLGAIWQPAQQTVASPANTAAQQALVLDQSGNVAG